MIRALAIVVAALVATAAHAEKPKKARWSISAITLKLFDQDKNAVVSIDKPPNPYGLGLDLLVSVKVKGPTEIEGERPTLSLTVDAPASSDEATGDHDAWHEAQTRAITTLGDKGAMWFLFLVPYQCYENVTFAAKLTGAEISADKTLAKNLGCAE